MQVAIMALASAAAIFFPVLLLAICWRRCNWLGAMLAPGLGFATMAAAMALGDAPIAGPFRAHMGLARVIGAPLGLIGGLIGSLLGPKPTPAEQAYFEELRDPSGDALYDCAQRRAAAAASQ